MECLICFETKARANLSCKHAVCEDCLKRCVIDALQRPFEKLSLLCPSLQCDAELTPLTVRAILLPVVFMRRQVSIPILKKHLNIINFYKLHENLNGKSARGVKFG